MAEPATDEVVESVRLAVKNAVGAFLKVSLYADEAQAVLDRLSSEIAARQEAERRVEELEKHIAASK